MDIGEKWNLMIRVFIKRFKIISMKRADCNNFLKKMI